MRGRGRILAVLVAGWAAAAAAEGPRLPFTLVEPESLALEARSAIAREVLRKTRGRTIGHSDHFLVVAGSLREVADTVRELEFARSYAADRLGLDTDRTDPALVVVVGDDRLWNRLMRGFGLRRDSLAMQVGRELYLKDDPEQKQRPDRIAHEVIHLLLADTFGARTPLWLDEGLAGHYGWLCATEFAIGQATVLYRNQPGFPGERMFPLDALLNMRRYPDDEDTARVFYRQADELTGVLADRLGEEGMRRFVHTVGGTDGDPLAVFRAAARLDDAGMAEVEEAMRRRTAAVRKP